MKINVEFDCTPEEARRLMGLPDLTPVHDRFVAMLSETMDGQVRPELLESMMKSWGPVSEASLGFWRQLFDASGRRDD